ncbi:MAG TPA: methyltransferase domain-containing protein [Candidatus Nanoarchaeia archaeon]|nr:methyltransferase domain-containing protein [Candidatus Nanoarchaeia archaeon]
MIKLNLGCGWRDFGRDWIHIDGGIYPHVEHHEITKLPYEDKSVDLIYASHVFEYFDREDGKKVLEEWYRVLKEGGILRVAVPDFEIMANLYSAKKFPLKNFLGPLYGRMKMGAKGPNEENAPIIYHKTIYDFDDLRELLAKIGFRNIIKYDWKLTPPHDKIDDHSQAYLPSDGFVPTKEKSFDKEAGYLISLNVEAVK